MKETVEMRLYQMHQKRHSHQVKRLAKNDAKMKEGWQCRLEVPTPVHRDIVDFDGVC